MERLLITGRRYLTRLAALVVLGLALALVTGAGPAAAGGTSINIAPKAYVYDSGIRLETQVTVTCTGPGFGTVSVTVSETAAQSSDGTAASGIGRQNANCDGSPHKLNVTVMAGTGLFSIGQATANAFLAVGGGGGTANDSRTIAIVHP